MQRSVERFTVLGATRSVLCAVSVLLPWSACAQNTVAAPRLTASLAVAERLPSAPAPSAEALERARGLILQQSSSSSTSSADQTTAPAQPTQSPTQQPQEPSLNDLGLSPTQTTANPALQARLDRHTQMLKIHQRLGLLTLIPLAATVISSGGATADHHGATGTATTGGNTAGRDLHAALGSVAVGMYAATAYYAIRAPKVSEGPSRGGIKLHKYLIYIHAPGMVLTPILGAMAFNQLNNGQKVHGIASAHSAVAWTTVLSYSAAMVAVSWPIHLKGL